MKPFVRALALAGWCAVSSAALAQAPTPASETSAFAALVASRSAVVVDVIALRTEREAGPGEAAEDYPELLPDNEFADRFAVPLPVGMSLGQTRDLGSGVILSSDGFILTSGHIVAGADEIQVRLRDGRKFRARLVGADRHTDVGVLKIEASGLPVALFGDSSALAAGTWVAAIGSPFGFQGSVTTGVVSATERYMSGAGEIPFIQTDVAINPGSSGSPLFNSRGEVVALNSMIYSGSGGYMGLSFAVPINLSLRIAQQLRIHGSVQRARLGAQVQEVSPALAQAFGLSDASGALVVQVETASPAESAGLLRGDVVHAIDGTPVVHFARLLQAVAQKEPGARVRLDVWRHGQATALWAILLKDPSAAAHPRSDPLPDWYDGLGLALGELSRAQREQLHVKDGLMVRLAAGSARSEGIRAGDLILAVNDMPLRSVAEFTRILSRMPASGTVALLVRRSGRTVYVPIALPERAARRNTAKSTAN